MLEQKIEALTEAVSRNTEAVLALAEAHKAAAETKPKQTRQRRTKKDEPETPKALTVEDIKNGFVAYLGGEKDEQGKQRLVDTVKPILAEIGVDRVTAIEEGDRPRAMEYLKILQNAYDAGGLEAAEGAKLPFAADPQPEAESVL